MKQKEEVWKDIWRTHYDDLATYKAEHGDCNVPRYYEANKSLGRWVNTQRTAYRNNKLSEERVRKLTEIGFVWGLQKKNYNEEKLREDVLGLGVEVR